MSAPSSSQSCSDKIALGAVLSFTKSSRPEWVPMAGRQDSRSSRPTVLWIGGSSGLASTYFEELKPPRESFIVCGPDPRPQPPHPSSPYPFVECDLMSHASVRTLFTRLEADPDVTTPVHTVILGVRLSLLSTDHEKLGVHLKVASGAHAHLRTCGI